MAWEGIHPPVGRDAHRTLEVGPGAGASSARRNPMESSDEEKEVRDNRFRNPGRVELGNLQAETAFYGFVGSASYVNIGSLRKGSP